MKQPGIQGGVVILDRPILNLESRAVRSEVLRTLSSVDFHPVNARLAGIQFGLVDAFLRAIPIQCKGFGDAVRTRDLGYDFRIVHPVKRLV